MLSNATLYAASYARTKKLLKRFRKDHRQLSREPFESFPEVRLWFWS